jgi:hypothetical protein
MPVQMETQNIFIKVVRGCPVVNDESGMNNALFLCGIGPNIRIKSIVFARRIGIEKRERVAFWIAKDRAVATLET